MEKKFWRDIRTYWPYAFQSAKASLKAEVAGSYLNWLWLIINPLSFMLIYTFIFGVVFQAAEPYFPLYVFIGLTMWDFFNHNIVHSVSMIKYNRNLLCKIYMPKFILVLSDMAVNAMKLAISFGVVAVMMLFSRIPPRLSDLYVLPVLLCMFLFTFGLSNLVMHMGVYIRDLISVVNIVMRLLFYFTGIFYNIETRIPGHAGRWILCLNPMACFITQVRGALIEGRLTHPRLLLVWFILSLALAIWSVHVVYRSEDKYVKVV